MWCAPGSRPWPTQTRDNVDALKAGGLPIPELKVDGGATRNDLLCQFQADTFWVFRCAAPPSSSVLHWASPTWRAWASDCGVRRTRRALARSTGCSTRGYSKTSATHALCRLAAGRPYRDRQGLIRVASGLFGYCIKFRICIYIPALTGGEPSKSVTDVIPAAAHRPDRPRRPSA